MLKARKDATRQLMEARVDKRMKEHIIDRNKEVGAVGHFQQPSATFWQPYSNLLAGLRFSHTSSMGDQQSAGGGPVCLRPPAAPCCRCHLPPFRTRAVLSSTFGSASNQQTAAIATDLLIG